MYATDEVVGFTYTTDTSYYFISTKESTGIAHFTRLRFVLIPSPCGSLLRGRIVDETQKQLANDVRLSIIESILLT